MLNDIKSEVIAIVKAHIDQSSIEIQDSTSIIDVVVSSLAMLKILAKIENKYGISIPEEQIFELETFADLYQYIREHTSIEKQSA